MGIPEDHTTFPIDKLLIWLGRLTFIQYWILADPLDSNVPKENSVFHSVWVTLICQASSLFVLSPGHVLKIHEQNPLPTC